MLNFFKKIYNFFIDFFSPVTCIRINKNRPTIQLLNDPTSPNLSQNVFISKPAFSNFTVRGLIKTGNPLYTLPWQNENVYANINGSLLYLRNFFPVNLKSWASTKNLMIYPRAGNDANAYYDRKSLKFFYFTDDNNKKIFTCNSADVITHELGHAILDAIRPDFWNIASFEIGAYHEAFGDITAILSCLNYNIVLDTLLTATGNDLRKDNFVSGLAEEFGISLKIGNALRNSFNSYVYVDPITLPENGNGLIQEIHSFAEVWTGTFYELLTEFFELFGKDKAALIKARDLSADFVFKTAKDTPATKNLFFALAKTYLAYDLSKYGGQYKNILTKVFSKRGLISSSLVQNLSEDNFNAMSSDTNILFKEIKFASLSSTELGVLNINGLDSINVELPCDTFKTKNGLFNSLSVGNDEQESKDAAKSFVNYLINRNQIGDSDMQSWFVEKNTKNLVRKHACCGDLGFINNCTIEGQPEYGKCWKPANNSGCCPYGCPTTPAPTVSVKVPCSIGYNSCNINSYNSCGSNYYSVCNCNKR